jgi:hypothetical protein
LVFRSGGCKALAKLRRSWNGGSPAPWSKTADPITYDLPPVPSGQIADLFAAKNLELSKPRQVLSACGHEQFSSEAHMTLS